jgi:hypothetical protein
MDRRIKILMASRDPIGSAATLEMKQAVACELIDRDAGRARTRWSVAYPFQDEEYRLAATQAESYLADPEGGPFGTLQADIDAGTIDPRNSQAVSDLAEAADLILFKRAVYETALTDIRTARLSAKATAKAATNEAQIRQATNIAWPNP